MNSPGTKRAQKASSRPVSSAGDRKRDQRVAALEALQVIPGVGRSIAADLYSLGIGSVGDLKNKDPEQLFQEFEARVGAHVDRCVLYTFRCAVYYASHKRHDPALLCWWHWKDRPSPPIPAKR